MSNNASNKQEPQDLSRRNFVKNTGLLVGGVVVGGVLGGTLFRSPSVTVPTVADPLPPPVAPSPAPNFNRALMYFTTEQYAVIDAAVERIFPKDEHGSGAQELGAAFFIDHQLASGWGLNAKEYMSGPFFPGEPTQGYQGSLNRQQIFDIGIKGLQDYSQVKYQNKFENLTEDEQDEVLTAFDKGEVQLRGVSSSYFFSLLRSATLEGVYADPLYGGNANMDGWKMKEYPGDQMSYKAIMEKDEFIVFEPSSLKDHIR